MKVRVTRRAGDDLDGIFDYLNERSPLAANAVMRAIRGAIDIVAAYPQASPLTSISGVRAKIVKRYRYVIFYRIRPDAVEVLRVRHGAQETLTAAD
jgi:addiction module RelE/StbE family toxin